MEEIRCWVEESPYSRFLGVQLEHVDEKSARLVLPYQDANSNPGKALHGGCAASIGAIGGQAVARAALGAESGPWHTAQMQVSYLAAAIGEDVIADAELLYLPEATHTGLFEFPEEIGARVERFLTARELLGAGQPTTTGEAAASPVR